MYKNKEDMNRYLQERYYKRKRWAFTILGNACHICGSTKGLQIDHHDYTEKKFNITTFLRSRTEEYLLAELKKCQLLCKQHHSEKTDAEGSNRVNKPTGEDNGQSKLTYEAIEQIKTMRTQGFSRQQIANKFSVSRAAVWFIDKGKTWRAGRVA